ncbi:MAG: aldose epimerase family protein, partial [Planctomycetota bacterium]
MKTTYLTIFLALAVLLMFGCNESFSFGEKKMSIEKQAFGKTPDGKDMDLYTLTNANGLKTQITNYGGIVTTLHAPDRDGKLDDIVLGYETLDEYIADSPYFGALIGRCGNRVGKAKFTLEGIEYTLAANNDENHLHGGIKGFDKVVWDAEPLETPDGPALKLTYLS